MTPVASLLMFVTRTALTLAENPQHPDEILMKLIKLNR
jgi:hypothetical protein